MPIKGLPINSMTIAAPFRVSRNGLICTFFLLCGLFLCNLANAQTKPFNAVILGPSTSSLNIGHNTLVQQDVKNAISEQRIRETYGAVLTGKVSDSNIINLGHEGTSHWLAFKLMNKDGAEDWILDLGSRHEGRVGNPGRVRVFEMPLAFPGVTEKPAFYLKELKTGTKGGLYKINALPQTQKLIIINVQPATGIPSTLPLSIHSSAGFFDDVQTNASYNAFYCTMLIFIALLFGFLAINNRQYPDLVFALYYIFAIGAYLAYDRFYTDGMSEYFKPAMMTIMTLYSALCLYMAKIFCRIDHSNVSEKFILYGLIGISTITMIIASILPPQYATLQMSLLYGVPAATIAIITIISYIQMANVQIAGYEYSLSWLMPLVGLIISGLSAAGIIYTLPLLLNTIWFALLPQGLLLLVAMNKKLKSIHYAEEKIRSIADTEQLKLNRLKQTKDEGDHSRLLRVIEKEREMLEDLRQKESVRMDEMRRAKEAADEANRAKSAFLAVVSHEIRTPMTGIMGMVRLLLDSNISKQQKDYVMTIQESGDSMLGLLNDILDFEKIQRGKMELENISFDLHRLIQGIITLMSGHAADKKVSLSARMDDDLPRYVKGDPTRIRQVLLNLMGNALKFTENGTVTLLVKTMQSPDTADGKGNHFMVYFAVMDTGIGISEDAQKNLFTPFAQADSSIARKFGGSGLGLAISKGLIQAMGSSINISSKSGEGSTFFFTLKMERGLSSHQEPTKKITTPESAARAVKPLKILVVDDNTINRKVISSFLYQDNHIVTTSITAEDALEKIDAENFDIILMDIELPGISGNEATKKLRDHPDPAKARTPVIALTGNVGTEYLQRYLADGMNALIAKPIDPDKLKNMVVEMASASYEREITSPLLTTIQEAPVAAPVQAETNIKIFNPDMLQSLKDAIGIDQLNHLLDELIVKTDEILAAMDVSAKAGDLENLLARAHELKGMAGNFGLVEISEIASKAERKAKTSELDGLGELIETLPDASVRAKEALAKWSQS